MAVRRPIARVRQLQQYADDGLAVGEIGIAFAVAPGLCCADPWYLAGRDQHAGGGEVAHQPIALGVDVGADVMSDRAGVMAEADAAVKACRAKPKQPAVVSGRSGLPEADVVAPVGAVADRLFEG